jgi:hypothetical protein
MTLNPFTNQDLHNVKLSNLVVMRGRLTVDAGPGVQRIHLVRDDHQPNLALRFIKGYIFQDSQDGLVQDTATACKLSTSTVGGAFFDASDYNQIAWITNGRATPEVGQKDYNDIIDPTNIISHDLYAEFWNEATFDIELNYLFMFQRVDLDDTSALVVTLDNYIS